MQCAPIDILRLRHVTSCNLRSLRPYIVVLVGALKASAVHHRHQQCLVAKSLWVSFRVRDVFYEDMLVPGSYSALGNIRNLLRASPYI